MKLINMTIGECLEHRGKTSPNDIFLKQDGECFSWTIVNIITNKLALYFLDKGIEKGDKVGILGSNSLSWIVSFFALQKIGAAAVLINACYKEREVLECIKISKMKFLLYTTGYEGLSYEKMINMLKKDKESSSVKYLYIEKTSAEWEKLSNCEMHTHKKMPNVESNDLACVLFTSGTTNNSKGVRLSHYSLVNNARTITEQMRWTKDDCMCLAVPLFHCFGVTVSLLTSLFAGFKVVILERYKTLSVCDAIQDEKCTILNGVPSMFLVMSKNKERLNYNLDTLKSGIIAGSPIFEGEYLEFCKMFKNMKLQPSYGLTETSPCVTISDYDAPAELKAKSAGKVVEHVQVKIVNNCTGEVCGINEPGEIFVKGYNVAMGYLTSDETSSVEELGDDEWLKTGDIGYIDADNYLHISGRKKNIIIRGGENISPFEIESFVREITNKKEVFVFGKKTEVMQEEIVACIEGKETAEELEKIKKFLTENLSKYKIPKYFIFIEEMPRNSTGKLDQKKIKEIVTEKLNINYTLKLMEV